MSHDTETVYPVAARARRPQRTRSHNWGSLLLAVMIGVGVGAMAFAWLNPPVRFRTDANDPTVQPRPSNPITGPDAEEQQALAVFDAARESVVNVDTVLKVRNRLDMQVQEQQAGTGSGFVWDTDGRVVTNFHVVRQAIANGLTIRVVMADRTSYEARIVGYAPDYDLAVLQIPAPKDKLKPITLGRSAELQVGRKAFAIGNPFGLSLSMTKGVISAVDREIESPGQKPITGAIQTDAPINPGNSGGPLLDKDGRLIGVNTSIATPSGGNVGIGFAIPVDTVNPVVTELIQRGRIQQPDLGLKLVDERRIRRAGYANGVMVESVEPDGPAAKAGLRGLTANANTREVLPGDLIVAVNGAPIRGTLEFVRKVATLTVGQTVTLTVERDEKPLELPLIVRGV